MAKHGYLIAATTLVFLVGCAPPDSELEGPELTESAPVDETGPEATDDVAMSGEVSSADDPEFQHAPACGSGFTCEPLVNDLGTTYCRTKTVNPGKWVTLETSIAGFTSAFRIGKPTGAEVRWTTAAGRSSDILKVPCEGMSWLLPGGERQNFRMQIKVKKKTKLFYEWTVYTR